jgi:hypothetical protein
VTLRARWATLRARWVTRYKSSARVAAAGGGLSSAVVDAARDTAVAEVVACVCRGSE